MLKDKHIEILLMFQAGKGNKILKDNKIGCLNWLSIYYFYLTKVQTLPCPIQRTNNGDTKISIRAAVPIRHPAQPTPVLDRHAPDAYSRPNTLTLHRTSRPPSHTKTWNPRLQSNAPPHPTNAANIRQHRHHAAHHTLIATILRPPQTKQPLTTRSVETYPKGPNDKI